MNIFCKCLCVNHTFYQLEYSSQKHCIRFATTLSFCKWFLPYEMLSQIKVGLHYQVMVLERKGYKRTYFISVCFELTFFFFKMMVVSLRPRTQTSILKERERQGRQKIQGQTSPLIKSLRRRLRYPSPGVILSLTDQFSYTGLPKKSFYLMQINHCLESTD